MKKKGPEKTKKMVFDYEGMFSEDRDYWKETFKKLENGEYVVGENYIVEYEPSECLMCNHLEQDIYGCLSCEAFPDEIPSEVYNGTHYKKHPLQQGEITFEIDNQLTDVYEMVYDEDGNRIPKLKPYTPEEKEV